MVDSIVEDLKRLWCGNLYGQNARAWYCCWLWVCVYHGL